MVSVQESIVCDQTATYVANLVARLQPLNVRVERVSDGTAAATYLTKVATEIGAPGFVVSSELTSAAPGLMAALTVAGVAWLNPADVSATRDAPLGVSLASLAVAETGSVMLAEATLTDRAVGMLTKTHVILVRTGTIVPSLDEAGEALKAHALRPGGGYASLVTGPSRTADIELSLSLGVQGPERVYVLVVDELS
ncbi:MAG: L-lactate dehydrogenase complex protein LldG [Thermomicrobiales bacterium]|nr:L-lactate dehydrogenase complex protein LldG [Thermomicrobiales bacterium]